METLLEQQRRYHEERERLMDGMVQVQLAIFCSFKPVFEEKIFAYVLFLRMIKLVGSRF